MIKIKDLTIRNFLSVGNITQSIDFDQNLLTLILGENLDQGGKDNGARNGCGKSTLTHALSYVLFGEPLAKIKLDNLVNRINGKNMMVTCSFEKDGILHRIERGRKPAVFKYIIDGKPKDEENESQGESKDTQKEINAVLSMDHTMYKNIVSLNTYSTPFLGMGAADQREIIENLLGITILSEKAEKLKASIKDTKDLIAKETAIIDAANASNKRIQDSIDKIVATQSEWFTRKYNVCQRLQEQILGLSEIDIDSEIKLHAQIKSYNEKKQSLDNLNKQKDMLEKALIQADSNVTKLTDSLEKLVEKKCPACEQGIHSEKHEEMQNRCADQLESAIAYMDDICTQVAKVLEELDAIGPIGTKPITHYRTLDDAHSHQTNLKMLQDQLARKQEEQDPYQTQIDELKASALTVVSWDNINELVKLKEHQDFLLKLLTNKDSFIRKLIIDQNLTFLNNRLSEYLEKMGLPHLVTFLNDLSVEITYLGHDLDFANLSRGEMTRLSLSLSFAFRDVWENLYQPINLMIVDELIDNGLDAYGAESSVNLLQYMISEQGKNVFLISHKEELMLKVNNVLKAVKESGFTSYTYME